MYLAIQPPSMITAIGQRPSTLAVELFYTETRACALWIVSFPRRLSV